MILLMGKFLLLRHFKPYCKQLGLDFNFRLQNQIRSMFSATNSFIYESYHLRAKNLFKSFVVQKCATLRMKEKVKYFNNILIKTQE